LSYTFEQAIAWLASGAIDAASIVSEVVPLGETATMLDRFGAGRSMKVQAEP
jgi:threonine dehydrogenase-like Zn-dependent dehydrogenase